MKRFVALLFVLVLFPGIGRAGTTLQQRIEAQSQKTRRLEATLHQKRAELHAAALTENELQTELNQTNGAISNVNARLGSLAAQQRSTERRLAWNTTQLDAAQRSLRLQDRLLKKRLVDIYENGDMSYAAVLLSAHSFSEFVERWEDLRLLIAANQRTVAQRKKAESKVAAAQAELERSRIALSAEQVAQQQARSQLGALAGERRNLVAFAEQRRTRKATEVAQLEELSAAQEAQLEALIRQRQRELEAQREASRRAAGIAGAIPPPNEGAPKSFSWPVNGTITSPFGWRSNPFGGAPDFHTGLDIAAPTGTTIVAAASGTVILAQWYGGYGNFVLIDHGGHVSTGYGHMSAIYVSVGQHVQRGQAIGAVGMTGLATGPHVHFEIRINGKPVDPAPRLH
ncbi:MAG: murein hydrolase activator EnvC family protein [Vulcanimicrobiaceae bacterium]